MEYKLSQTVKYCDGLYLITHIDKRNAIYTLGFNNSISIITATQEVLDFYNDPKNNNEAKDLNYYAKLCHNANISWWKDLKTGDPLQRNKAELMMLMVTELAESCEAMRKDLSDDKLPQYKGEYVELIDLLIRALDYLGAYGVNVQEIFDAKMEFNKNRSDHKPENRLKENGKKF